MAIMIAVVVGFLAVIGALVGSQIWLARTAIRKTELAAKLEVEKAHIASTKDAYNARRLQLESDLFAERAAHRVTQEALDTALEELHETHAKELRTAPPDAVPAVVGRMLKDRAARRAVSRAAGHSPEPTGVPAAPATTSSDPGRVDRGD